MAGKRRPFWVLDSETDPFEEDREAVERRQCPECKALPGFRCKSKDDITHQPRRRIPFPFIWGLYGGASGEEYHEFETVADVVRFLEGRRDLVYAHNGGKFDYHYLRDHINTGEPLGIINGRLSKFKIGECEFRDSMNILPVPLATFKKDEFDYSKMEAWNRDIPAVREEIRKYLRNDCVYLYELIEAHRKENGVALTQAGASMRSWAKQSRIKPPRQSAARYQEYKEYYYGGRVQCFESGYRKTNFKLIDINSAYPFAMLSPHPFSVTAERTNHLPRDSELHKCMITLTCCARGCFPFRSEDKSLFFPHDEKTIRRYHITGYEFITALKLDAIRYDTINIETVHYFSESVKFEEFIQSNWDRRLRAKAEGNKALDIIVKLLMNSLYGKFASDYSKYKEFMLEWLEHVPARMLEGFEQDTDWKNGKILLARSIPEEKHRFYNIATAASITGYVRAMLFEAISKTDQPLYCDTDSIAAVGLGSLEMGDGLGGWKHEGDFDDYAIAGKKTYALHKAGKPYDHELDSKGDYLNYKVACKGVDLNPDEIRRICNGEKITYASQVPTYSVKRSVPIFTPRKVQITARDIRNVPEETLQ